MSSWLKSLSSQNKGHWLEKRVTAWSKRQLRRPESCTHRPKSSRDCEEHKQRPTSPTHSHTHTHHRFYATVALSELITVPWTAEARLSFFGQSWTNYSLGYLWIGVDNISDAEGTLWPTHLANGEKRSLRRQANGRSYFDRLVSEEPRVIQSIPLY